MISSIFRLIVMCVSVPESALFEVKSSSGLESTVLIVILCA